MTDLIPAPQDSSRPENTEISKDSAAEALPPRDGDILERAHDDDHHGSNIMILWPDRGSRESRATAAAEPLQPRRSRLVAAAMIAALFGAVCGSATTIGWRALQSEPAEPDTFRADFGALRENVARLRTDLTTLRGEFEKAGRSRTAQLNSVGDRLARIEKAQEDNVTRITRLSEGQDRMRADQDATGSIAPKSDARLAKGDSARSDGAKTDAAKADPRKPPIVEGWTLTRVAGGGAIVDGPTGLYEAFPGDPLPGLGRVDAIRYQDGRWVVVTTKGLIIRR